MISIIIPTLNEGLAIEETLKNLADGLKITPYEIIVSDGKSTDNTVAIARKYAKEVVLHELPTRQKISQGKNAGAKKAAGDYLVFIDADMTIPEPDKFFALAIGDFEKKPDLVGLGCRIQVLPELERFSDWFFRLLHHAYNVFVNNILRTGTGSGEFQMARRTAFEQIGGFDENIVASEDHDLFRRLSKLGRVIVDSKLTIYEKGRRARAVGWPRLLFSWIANGLSVSLFNKSVSKEWKEIR